MRAPLITITCDCGATAEVAYGDRWSCPTCGSRGTRRRFRPPTTTCSLRGVQPLPATSCSARRSCSRLILIPLAVLVGDPVRVPPLRARDGVRAARRPAAPAPRRRPRCGAARRAGSCGRSSRARHPTHPHERGHPGCLGQPPGDARHLRRAVRAGGDRARRRCGGRVGAAADHRQRRRGAARADLARDEVRVHRHRRRSRTRSRRRPRSPCRSRSRSSGCASAARARSRRCSSSLPSARRACSSSAPTATRLKRRTYAKLTKRIRERAACLVWLPA